MPTQAPFTATECAVLAKNVFVFGGGGAPKPTGSEDAVSDEELAYGRLLAEKTGGDPHKVLHMALVSRQRLSPGGSPPLRDRAQRGRVVGHADARRGRPLVLQEPRPAGRTR